MGICFMSIASMVIENKSWIILTGHACKSDGQTRYFLYKFLLSFCNIFFLCITYIISYNVTNYIQGSVLLFTYLKRRSNKNESMHFSSDGTTEFLEKLSYFNNFGITVVLSLHYQLPFL